MLQKTSDFAIETKEQVQYLETGLVFDNDINRGEWNDIGLMLKTASKGIQWWVGDWLNFGERKWGEMYTQALEATDYSDHSLRIAKYVSAKIELFRRRNNLSWGHHAEVAALSNQQQDYWLDYAEKNNLSVHDLRREIKGGIKELPPIIEGDFSWFKDDDYKRAQEVLKPDYRHFIDRLTDKGETSTATQYVAQMEYRWMMERCVEIEKKWGIDES